MSRKDTMGPEYFRYRDDERRTTMTHETMVDLINSRRSKQSLLDALSFGYGFVPEAAFAPYMSSDDEDYDDGDRYGVPRNHSYCGFPRNFLGRGLPKPSKHITPEEAERNANELVDEEEKLKKKAERKKQKKLRQKERRRQEKVEKENADKDKNKPQVGPRSQNTKHAENDQIKSNKCTSVPSGPQHTSDSVQSSDGSDGSDEDEDSTTEPEELDMNSCFVSNAAAIAKRKLEEKPKPEKKATLANSCKEHGSEQKVAAVPQKQIDNNKEVELVNASDFIAKSVELAVLGNQYAASGNLEMAVKYFTDAIKHNPKEYKLFGNRSSCYENMLQYEKALTDAEIALSMNPKWIKGLYRKGKALVGLKRYFEARLIYNEVLKLDSTCKDAAEEMMRVQLMQLMEMGFTREQSSNALILHGTIEKALEGFSGVPGFSPVHVPRESVFMSQECNPQPPVKFPLRPLPQNQHRPNIPVTAPLNHHPPELFPVWVGDLVPSITEGRIYSLFKSVGPVHSVRVLPARRCAFVNYTRKEDSETAIQDFNGHAIDGRALVVRYPDRKHTHLGVSRDASTESPVKAGNQPDECYFWRRTGCIKMDRCTFQHIPENKGIDRNKEKSYL
ncbi:tetratricopeptide repeat protein 31-like isoform X2 [Xyrauchen texanus]|uniref:tetratricopeptide repeat protein 31-like isoform X2 n=1 Tax=Xyrauchen texanus TaxID=154827 RepID=UPI002241904E|nr:tetratricopeptide repeat protein 31-like isoform X2 [Xyrauchen texanus]